MERRSIWRVIWGILMALKVTNRWSWSTCPTSCYRRYCRTGACGIARAWGKLWRIGRQKLISFCQFWSDDFEIAIRHSQNGPKQCQTSKFRLAKALNIDMSKIKKERGPPGWWARRPWRSSKFGIISFLRDLAGPYACLIAILKSSDQKCIIKISKFTFF